LVSPAVGILAFFRPVCDSRSFEWKDERKAERKETKMIDHLSSYTTDFPAARAFYEAALGALGYAIQVEMVADWDPDFPERRCCAWGPRGKSVFWVIETREAATPRHIAFTASDRASVDGFHEAALGAGGCEHGAPGVRAMYHPDYYGAFVLDPDDNNVEAVCHTPE
jgi:catechol 2,3-dioxygenase-like lactoylglutathione lyase family enzyme